MTDLSASLAPSFVAAACYAAFGRIVWWVAPASERTLRTLWCPPRFVTLLFVTLDLLSFFVQLLGAGYAATSIQDDALSARERDERLDKGMATMRVGLWLQLVCFLTFAVVGARFLLVSRRWSASPARNNTPHVRWEELSWAVNAAATLVLVRILVLFLPAPACACLPPSQVRTIYRVFEFSGGGDTPGYVRSHEWLFWVFDGLPMLCASSVPSVLIRSRS